MRSPSRLVVPLVLAGALAGPPLLAGCSSGGGTSGSSAASTTSETAASTGSAASSSPPPFAADLRPDTASASAGASGTITAIRLAPDVGFDRVAFEFRGKGTPGWNVRYVDHATQQGSGKQVDIPGNAVLEVSITGVGLPADTGVAEYSGPNPLATANTEAVTQVVFGGTFEGTTQAFIGTANRTPFRVYLLQSPARVVVEVADQG